MKGSRALTNVVVASFIAVFAVLVGRLASQQVAPPANDPRQIAEALSSPDKTVRNAAIAAALALPPERATVTLRSAATTLMDEQSEVVANARARGVSLDQLEDPEAVSGVQRAVANLNDPATIPALARTLGSTFVAVRPLAQFGEPAAAHVLSVVESTSHYSAV